MWLITVVITDCLYLIKKKGCLLVVMATTASFLFLVESGSPQFNHTLFI